MSTLLVGFPPAPRKILKRSEAGRRVQQTATDSSHAPKQTERTKRAKPVSSRNFRSEEATESSASHPPGVRSILIKARLQRESLGSQSRGLSQPRDLRMSSEFRARVQKFARGLNSFQTTLTPNPKKLYKCRSVIKQHKTLI